MAPTARRDMSALGKRIIARMSEIGMKTQIELAARSGLGEATVNRLLYDLRSPRLETLRQVAAALDLPTDDLLPFVYDEATPMPEPTPVPPIAAEIIRMLADDSPVPADEKRMLAELLDRVVDPHRRHMRRKQP